MRVEEFIGSTPLVELRNSGNPRVKLFVKLEGNNPGGSVKDRAAYSMLREALDSGKVRPGDHVVEATSGNTGIALAMVANLLGLKITLVMPENASRERIQLMEAYQAEVILTDASKSIEYSRLYAQSLADKYGWFILNQFANEANPRAHYLTTGPEIWNGTNGQVSHFVSAMGTTGTIMGVSRYLREQDANVKIIGVQPEEGESIPGIRKWSDAMIPDIYNPEQVDKINLVTRTTAIEGARKLAINEGVFAGISSGGAYQTALKLAKEIPFGTIVFVACDRGDRYLSTDVFNQNKKMNHTKLKQRRTEIPSTV